jgi:gliding motility-associated-like protein
VNNGCLAPYEPILVTVQPPAGVLCTGGSVALAGQVSGPVTGVYWQGGSGVFSDPTSASTTYTAGPGDVGTVSLSLCAMGTCGAPTCTTIDVPVVPPPTVTITANGPPELCPGASLALLASGADTFVWQPGGAQGAQLVVTAAGTYSVAGTTVCGQGEASITVAALPPTNVVIAGNTSFCTGSSTTLTASGAVSYVWNTGASSASITVQQGGTYTVTGTGVCGTGTASVQVAEIALPTVTIAGDTSFCTGSSITLTASGADSYLWNTGATGASIAVQQGGTYTVTGANACGSDQAAVTVDEVNVSAVLIASPQSGTVPLTVFFTNQSTPGNASFVWDFGDGATSTAFAPQHTYTAPGTYAVTLTASFGGCEATAVAYVQAGTPAPSESFITVPNVFSPNGDGRNDVLEVLSNGISSLDMTILNRWGQVVARIERPGQVWDSRSFAGERCPEGSYFYVLKATGEDGRSYDLSGTITLVR